MAFAPGDKVRAKRNAQLVMTVQPAREDDAPGYVRCQTPQGLTRFFKEDDLDAVA